MKRFVFTIVATMCMLSAFAQSENFIHMVYDPMEVELLMFTRFEFDITGDSIPEFYFEQNPSAIDNSTLNGWECCTYNPEHPEIVYTFQDLKIAFDDDSMNWGSYFTPSAVTPAGSYPALYECKEAMRLRDGDDCYYGWWDGNVVWGQNGNPTLIIRESCYCTIPNYPLRWGQTSQNQGFEETEATAFANIHPNPTNGTFTITGKDLKQAEVLNTLGQCVVTTQGKGETLHIDIANLPTGIYFVRITDEEGRKCVRKVVKE